MAKPPERDRRPSAEEADLFERAVKTAREIPKKPGTVPKSKATPKPAPTPPPATGRTPAAKTRAVPPDAPPERKFVLERRASVPGLDRRTTERLSKGQLPIEGRLDLHGHRQDDAHRALQSFVLASAKAGRRCVLVITGKGQSRDGEGAFHMPSEAPGVLRRNLPRWLGAPPLADKVLAIRPALPQHGGEGAFYVLLRRSR